MFDVNVDIKQIFRNRLASSMGLDQYQIVMESYKNTDISKDKEFQRTFNGFYLVRRNEVWRKTFYEYFERNKNLSPTFEEIITYLYEQTGNIEPSFSSKLLATLNPDKPIWDRYVVENLNLKLKGKTQEEKLENAIRLYAEIEQWYSDFLKTEKAKECIKIFNDALPEYAWISSVKKVDAILWSIR